MIFYFFFPHNRAILVLTIILCVPVLSSTVIGSLFGNTQNKGFGFSSGLGTGTTAGTSGFGTGLGTTGLGGFGGFSIQPTQQQQGELGHSPRQP